MYRSRDAVQTISSSVRTTGGPNAIVLAAKRNPVYKSSLGLAGRSRTAHTPSARPVIDAGVMTASARATPIADWCLVVRERGEHCVECGEQYVECGFDMDFDCANVERSPNYFIAQFLEIQ